MWQMRHTSTPPSVGSSETTPAPDAGDEARTRPWFENFHTDFAFGVGWAPDVT